MARFTLLSEDDCATKTKTMDNPLSPPLAHHLPHPVTRSGRQRGTGRQSHQETVQLVAVVDQLSVDLVSLFKQLVNAGHCLHNTAKRIIHVHYINDRDCIAILQCQLALVPSCHADSKQLRANKISKEKHRY